MKKFIKIILMILISCAMLYIVGNRIYKIYVSDKYSHEFTVNRNSSYSSIDKVNYQEVNISSLVDKYNNTDIIGALEIENENYLTPVVQTKDNNYYLNHLLDKRKDFMGTPFLDYRLDIDDSKKLLIYAHNAASYDTPFRVLMKFYDKDYLEHHNHVILTTNNKVRIYEVFSVFTETKDFSYYEKIKFNDKTYVEHLNMLKSKSMYDIDTTLDKDTKILLLQTCSTHPDYIKLKYRYFIVAYKEIMEINK